MYSRWATFFLATGLAVTAGNGIGHAQGGISTEGGLTVFRTGADQSLVTQSLPFGAPTGPAVFRFDFGFATAEPDLPGTFFDSFSITLQRDDHSATALLLTADRTGVQWAPSNAGGLTVAPADVQHIGAAFSNLVQAPALRFAYSVSFLLPAALSGGPLTLFLDLFDNLNAAASLAYVEGVRMESAGPDAVRLHSVSALDGSFAEEPGAALDEASRTFTVPRPSGNRFFRVFTDRPTRISDIRVAGDQLRVSYVFENPALLALQTSGAARGPFSPATNALWDAAGSMFTLPKPGTNWFFRIAGDRTTRITDIRTAGGDVVIRYQVIATTLQSAVAPNGPYSADPGAVLNETNRTFTLGRPGGTRFYRVTSDLRSRLKAPREAGNQLILEYDFQP